MKVWRRRDIPDLTGRRAVVTGANSGIGLAVARALAWSGAHVTLACRDAGRGAGAVALITGGGVPAERVSLLPLDLADLSSVRAFSARFADDRLDILVNNAGVLGRPKRQTVDCFETHFGVNHLGHFALTAGLLPSLLAADDPRVVTLTSIFGYFGFLDFDNLDGERFYSRWLAYAQSKLANLLFAWELARRCDRIRSLAAHPGYARTNLFTGGFRRGPGIDARLLGFSGYLLAQSSDMGSLPVLYAATHPDVRSGALIGPALAQWWGFPVEVRPFVRLPDHDPAIGARLWAESERLTGTRFDVTG
ncbi:oxidoreductase [Fodinicola acaciae]|uniref:oxidoreductase n=1 Tax=Fodinicola acaciae TaxID=2681555 RepID=UPI0013D5C742|nr:oxidoreductase [Fodinicola acaciae]